MNFLKRHKKIILCTFLALLIVAAAGFWVYDYRLYNIEALSDEKVEEIKQSGAKKLMIVAHPDDETIWGGMHLIEGDYYVVCITNGDNERRAPEFKSILEATGSEGVIMSYPDKTYGKRDDWSRNYEDIVSDLEKVIGIKEWEIIVTHNPEGEYGHEHHKMTDRIVTEICEDREVTDNLYYFGKYYKKAEIEEMKGEKEVYGDETLLKQKEEILKLYESQAKTVNNLSHMNPYEEWVAYSEWE